MARECTRFLAGLPVPQAQACHTTCQSTATIGRNGHAVHRSGSSLQPAHLLAGLQVPQPYRPIQASGEDSPAVRQEGRAGDLGGMSLEAPDLLARLAVPQAKVLILAG